MVDILGSSHTNTSMPSYSARLFSTTATGTSEAQWGDYTGRLKAVTFTAYDPATSAMATITVASYSYDSTGQLRAAWDPRITSALTEIRLTGRQPWSSRASELTCGVVFLPGVAV